MVLQGRGRIGGVPTAWGVRRRASGSGRTSPARGPARQAGCFCGRQDRWTGSSKAAARGSWVDLVPVGPPHRCPGLVVKCDLRSVGRSEWTWRVLSGFA